MQMLSLMNMRMIIIVYQFRADRLIAVLIVFILHLLVSHKLQSAVRYAKHSRHESLLMRKRIKYTCGWN